MTTGMRREVDDLGRDFKLVSAIPSLVAVSMGDTVVVRDMISVLVVLTVLPHPVATVEPAGAANFGRWTLLEWRMKLYMSECSVCIYILPLLLLLLILFQQI